MAKKKETSKKELSEKQKASLKSGRRIAAQKIEDENLKLQGKIGISFIRSRFKNKFSAPQKFPIDKIKIKPEIFQGRTVPFAQETVDKILKEGYDTSQEPVVLWHDKDTNEDIVISGHSRTEAAKTQFKKGDKSLKTIPVKFFNGDRDDAIDYALIESNRSGKSEGIESDIKAYLRAKQRGYNKEFLKNIFKSDSYIDTLRLLSKLNPNGRFIEVLSKGEHTSAKSFPYLLRNANWTGNIRLIYPELTNAHEKEIFDFFYTTDKGLKIKKQAFFDLIKKKVESPYFKANNPLKLNKETEFDMVKESDAGFIRYKQIQAAISSWNDERLKKTEKMVEASLSNNTKIVDELESKIKEISTAIINKYKELLKLRKQLQSEDDRLKNKGLF